MAATLTGYSHHHRAVANIIVVQKAAAEGVQVGFRGYFRAGLPATLSTLAAAIAQSVRDVHGVDTVEWLIVVDHGGGVWD